MNLLITAIGKRVQLIKHLRKSFYVVGVDAEDMNAARHFTDAFYKIPNANEKDYINYLLKVCIKEEIDVLIPLYEGEFHRLNEERERFKNIGVEILLSGDEIIDITNDKKKTYKHFVNTNISVPIVYSDKDILRIIETNDITKFPLIVKPKLGMGSINVFKVNNIKQLEFFYDYVEDSVVQKYIDGVEYTVDCLVDLSGKPVYIIPRKRLEVRAGEVLKTTIHNDELIIENVKEVIRVLNEKEVGDLGLRGPITLQFFKTDDCKVYLLEVNARFGGGVPISFEVGANYGQAIKDMIEGKDLELKCDFEEKTMIRFDDAVFV